MTKTVILTSIIVGLFAGSAAAETKTVSRSPLNSVTYVYGLGTTSESGCWSETRRLSDGKLYRYDIVCPQGDYSTGVPVNGDFVNTPYSATKVRVLPNGVVELY